MRQERILTILQQLNRKFDKMAIDFTRLIADVETTKTVDAAILALVQSLVGQIKDLSAQLAAAIAANDPAAQQAVQDQLDALASTLEVQNQTVSDAVVANTPAQPAPQS